MPSYRLYPLTPDGSPEPPLGMAAFNDAAALRWAMGRAFPHGCDIFLGGRFIGRVHGPEATQPAPTVDDAGGAEDPAT